MLLSGGYYCECDSGFELDRRNENKCVDVNECRKGLCANGICRNKAGSFEFSRIFQPIRSFLTQKPMATEINRKKTSKICSRWLKQSWKFKFVELRREHLNVNVRLDFIYQVMENSVLITMNVSKRVCLILIFIVRQCLALIANKGSAKLFRYVR